jgi:uncharacterized protein
VRDRFWHESQEFKELSDVRLEFSLHLADLLELERLIIQWGGHAEDLEPPALRARLASAGKTITFVAAAHAAMTYEIRPNLARASSYAFPKRLRLGLTRLPANTGKKLRSNAKPA